jgi:hypothetical protein
MALCLFSLQTINTSESNDVNAQDSFQGEEAEARARIEKEQIEEWQQTKAQQKGEKRQLVLTVRSEEAIRPLIGSLEENERNGIQKAQKKAKNKIIKKEKRIEARKTKTEADELFDAITTNDVPVIKRIVRKNPLIVGDRVLNKTNFRDLAILYDNVTVIQEINDILAFEPCLQDQLMLKFPMDFTNGTTLKSIPLDAAVLLNSSPAMIEQIIRWNSFSNASFDSDTKRRLPEYFNINIPALQNVAHGKSLPEELTKAGVYIKYLMKACATLIDTSVLLKPENFPWRKRKLPIYALNRNREFEVTRQYSAVDGEEAPPRLVLRPVINLKELKNLQNIKELKNLQNILDIEEALKSEKERREEIEEARRRKSDFFDRSLPSPYHNYTKRIE